MRYLPLAFIIIALLVAGCGSSDGDGRAAAAEPTATREAAALLTPPEEIGPVEFPRDEAPHDDLTEWWYYTGHLLTQSGDRYGFEYVIFQLRRADFPAFYASHFAITDNPAGAFHFAEKSGFGADQAAEEGFDLELDGWAMSGTGGVDRLRASMDSYAFDLSLEATGDPVLHNQDSGYIDIGAAGGSYYYSRTDMAITGQLTVRGETLDVTGTAWMDHQWGNFVLIQGGGWDWFAVQLDNGEQLMVFKLRGIDGVGDVPDFGTLVHADGSTVHLSEDQFAIQETGFWTSSDSGATYPSGWVITIPDEGWQIEITPAMPDQELLTLESTGSIYWEGEALVEGTVDGESVNGLGYVELTGYTQSTT